MSFIMFVQIFGFVLIFIYLLCGIDDTAWFIWGLFSGLIRKRRVGDDELDFETLRNTPPKMLAISIAAWHEANVIGDVISNFMNTTDYPKSMYHLFVGVYPNDPETIAAVEAVSREFPNVHPVVNCMEGPTTKAQNINHVIRQIKNFESENNLRFASLTIHDSEDVIHSYELLATNYLIDSHDALQFPVFPIMEMPRFGNYFKQITTATYADEFAENHYISMVERRNMKAFVPCAGTGFAISRRRLEEFGDEDVLPSASLTEDYLLSLLLYKKGVQFHYVLNKLPRVMSNGKVRTDYITTRSLFPNTFRAAVRQKTRWTYGITMQSVSIKDVFTAKDIPMAGRYSFYKDLKAKFLNLLPLLGYVASVYCILAMFMDLEPLYREGSPVNYMAIAVFVMMIIRQIFRGYALYNVYGFRSVFFGCLLPPLFPLRLIYGNVINFVATVKAFRMRIFGEPAKKAEKKVEESAPAKKKTVKWAKTDHEFLTGEQLQGYRRMLGDALIVQGYLTPAQFNAALNDPDRGSDEHIGEYLVRRGLITKEQMIRALSQVKHCRFVPDKVVRRLNLAEIPGGFDREQLRKMRILPLTRDGEELVVGICDTTKESDLQAFGKDCGCRLKPVYMMEAALEEAFGRKAGAGSEPGLESLELFGSGRISYEQALLAGIYADVLGRPESEVREYMGIEA